MTTGSRPTFLVVDDEVDLLALLQFMLDDAEVLVASDGTVARRLLREHRVDVLLLDVTMPGEDGPMLLGRLRDEGLAPPVVHLMSAIPRSALLDLCASHDALPLAKPFTATQLRRVLAEHLPA